MTNIIDAQADYTGNPQGAVLDEAVYGCLKDIRAELKIMNIHLSAMTDIQLKRSDVDS